MDPKQYDDYQWVMFNLTLMQAGNLDKNSNLYYRATVPNYLEAIQAEKYRREDLDGPSIVTTMVDDTEWMIIKL